MNEFSIPVDLPGTAHPNVSLSCPTVGNCPQATDFSVGHNRHDHIRAAEDELDDAIDNLKTLATLAEDAGQVECAKEYTRRALAASRRRTAAHKDRLAREQLAGAGTSLDRGVDFLQAQGRPMWERLEGGCA